MLAELRAKSQITIPKEIIVSLGLNEGDKLEITEVDGAIMLMPVAVYPRQYIENLMREKELNDIYQAELINESLEDLRNGIPLIDGEEFFREVMVRRGK